MKKLLLILLATLVTSFAQANVEGELLPNEQAFAIHARSSDANTVRLEWDIADGYYMYRDKFKFESNTDSIKLGEAKIPPGKVKDDLIFGKVETYRKNVAVDIPIERAAGSPDELDITVTTQGCADLGVCYPPLIQNLKVKLAAAGGGNAVEKLTNLGESLGLGDGEEEFLPPDQAFAFSADIVDSDTLRASWVIAEGYYLYRDKFGFSLSGDEGVALGEIDMPPGKVKEDPFIGHTEVYLHTLEIPLPLQRAHGNSSEVTLEVKYQGCAEKGLCYPPATKQIKLALPAGTVDSATTSGADGSDKKIKGGFIAAILSAFGIGLLLTFTPCVLPMIPILSSLIVGEAGETVSKARGGALSFSYVIGTATTYTAAGIIAGMTGEQLQAYFQNVWAIGILSAILGVMALSMFGMFELQMPSFIQSRVQAKSATIKGGSFIRAYIMGLMSSLIVGACVSPLLITLLSLAIASKDPVLGGAIMFSMSMGMGVILIAIGVGAGMILPRAGTWMDNVKHVFGVMLLAVAIYLLSVLPQVPVLLLWATLFIITGVYMGATQHLPEGSSGWNYFIKGIGTVLLIWGILALIGGMYGNRDILKPLPEWNMTAVAQTGSATAQPAKEVFTKVSSLAELDQQLQSAATAGKPVLLDFYATWCTDCVRMEKGTFSNPEVMDVMQNAFVSLKVDVTDPTDADGKAIKQRYGVFGPPAMLFFDASGKQRKDQSFYGYRQADEFLAILNNVHQ